MVISEGVKIGVALGCAKGSLFSTVLTPAPALGQSITKCTLAILVGQEFFLKSEVGGKCKVLPESC